MRRLVLLVVLTFAAPAAAEPTMTERSAASQEDTTWRGPSGFWTNPRPAKGGAYRWRMMAVGGVLLLVTGYAMVRLVKRANADRGANRLGRFDDRLER